ncbi:hypothetical protein [Actinomyces slackii]|uniref:hypothetical protein n=1 Tax=Actinomyces slackii TaxID=52774 RepID=UPI000F84E3A0|nr:hypothetical protein [Actinomyces slackii]
MTLEDARKNAINGVDEVRVDGLEGEGVVFSGDEQTMLIWQYADGSYLTLNVEGDLNDPNDFGEAHTALRTELAKKLLQRLGSTIHRVAAGPRQDFIYYPKELAPNPNHTTATPLTPWPSGPSSRRTR